MIDWFSLAAAEKACAIIEKHVMRQNVVAFESLNDDALFIFSIFMLLMLPLECLKRTCHEKVGVIAFSNDLFPNMKIQYLRFSCPFPDKLGRHSFNWQIRKRNSWGF